MTDIVATLTVSQLNVTFSFSRWETDSGHVPVVEHLIQQEIRSPGVDGVRYLDDHLEMPPFQVATLESVTNYNAAVARVATYSAAQGLYGQLVVTLAGNTTTEKVKILDVVGPGGALSDTSTGGAARSGKPRPRSGRLASDTSGNSGLIEAVWSLRVVEE